jgi:hypothetical protein
MDDSSADEITAHRIDQIIDQIKDDAARSAAYFSPNYFRIGDNPSGIAKTGAPMGGEGQNRSW